jgi:HAD superfamily phosphoserine phosphatase-like hydrolase
MAKVVCFDFDDVLTDKDAAGRFLEVFGHTFSELRFGLELFEDNKHPKKFFRTLKKVVALGKGVRYERVERIASFIKPMKNARKTLQLLKKKGFKVVIISINDENMIKKFLGRSKMDAYVDHIYAGKLGVKNGLLTGTIEGEAIRTEKVGVVAKIRTLYGAKSEIYYVGDGMTDLPIMKKLGSGILFCPNAVTNAEVLEDRTLMKMQKDGKLFLVEDKDLAGVLEFIGN